MQQINQDKINHVRGITMSLYPSLPDPPSQIIAKSHPSVQLSFVPLPLDPHRSLNAGPSPDL